MRETNNDNFDDKLTYITYGHITIYDIYFLYEKS